MASRVSSVGYQLIFEGKLTDGSQPYEVKRNLVGHFNLPEERVDALLQRGHGTLKRNLTLPAARYMKQVFSEVGMQLQIYPPGHTGQAEQNPQHHERALEHAQLGAQSSANSRPLPFVFTGKGSDYFRFWLLNLLLSLLTLGVYGVWARVHTRRYFFENTRLDGHSFVYHAEPTELMKAQALPLLLMLLVVGGLYALPLCAPLMVLFMLPFIPCVVVEHLRFHARNTSYRYVHFGFEADYHEALMALIIWPLLGVATIGLAMPFALYRLRAFLVRHSRYGRTGFSFHATASDYYRIYLLPCMLVVSLAMSASCALLHKVAPGNTPLIAATLSLLTLIYLLLLLHLSVASFNQRFNATMLDEQAFRSQLQMLPLLHHLLYYGLLTLLSCGLAYPWARVAIVRYRIQSLSLLASPGYDHFIQAKESKALEDSTTPFALDLH